MDFLPEYVQEINDKNYVQKYLKGEWKSSGEFSHDLQKIIQNNDRFFISLQFRLALYF